MIIMLLIRFTLNLIVRLCRSPLALSEDSKHPIMLLATLGSVTLAWMSTLMREGKLDRKESGRPSSSSWKLSIIFYRQKQFIISHEEKMDQRKLGDKDEIILQPRWDLFHSLVCCIFPAWREASSVCTSWWRASHLLCRRHNRKSQLHPPARNRSLSSALAGPRPTYKPKAAIQLHLRRLVGLKHPSLEYLPVSYEVRILLGEQFILHSFTVHFLTDFINCSLWWKQTQLLL